MQCLGHSRYGRGAALSRNLPLPFKTRSLLRGALPDCRETPTQAGNGNRDFGAFAFSTHCHRGSDRKPNRAGSLACHDCGIVRNSSGNRSHPSQAYLRQDRCSRPNRASSLVEFVLIEVRRREMPCVESQENTRPFRSSTISEKMAGVTGTPAGNRPSI